MLGFSLETLSNASRTIVSGGWVRHVDKILWSKSLERLEKARLLLSCSVLALCLWLVDGLAGWGHLSMS